MRTLALAAALAVSLGSTTSAMADRSMHDTYPIRQSGEVHNGARPADRRACNDLFAEVASPSCWALTNPAPRPAWRGLN